MSVGVLSQTMQFVDAPPEKHADCVDELPTNVQLIATRFWAIPESVPVVTLLTTRQSRSVQPSPMPRLAAVFPRRSERKAVVDWAAPL